jgi:hypothetical protein
VSNISVTSKNDTVKLEVKKIEYAISLARTGGQGAASTTTSIGGLDIETSNLSDGDLLTVSSHKWVNVKQTNITDGGNF